MATHFFTSVAVNYIPKARVLARSIRRFHPNAAIHLVLADAVPDSFHLEEEPFSRLWTLEDIDIPKEPGWLFEHSLVELSTAVKGFVLWDLLNLPDCDSVIYFDPDIVLLASLDRLLNEFESGSILLTPHSTEPDEDTRAIEDHELVALRHGTFNLGFLGVKNDDEGRRFAAWWRHRLRMYCFDAVSFGLFTDQRWADLVPSFFPGHRILTDPAYNVCTWNLNSRTVTGTLQHGLLVNGRPLVFYHFSGFDRGAQKSMLDRYGGGMRALYELRAWYRKACDDAGQAGYGTMPWALGRFPSGEPILQAHRNLYRADARVRSWFPDPYQTGGQQASYADWFRSNAAPFLPPQPAPLPPDKSIAHDWADWREPSYRIFVLVTPEDARHAAATFKQIAQATASSTPVYVTGTATVLEPLAIPACWTKEIVGDEDPNAVVAELLARYSDRDLMLIRSGVLPPQAWDLRLAWSALRNDDALTVSPLARSTVDPRGTLNDFSSDRFDKFAYWYRAENDPEIATFSSECFYLRAEAVRHDPPFAHSSYRHRVATHVLVDDSALPIFNEGDSVPGAALLDLIRSRQLPAGMPAAPDLDWETGPEPLRYFSGPQAPLPLRNRSVQLYWDTGSGFSEGASVTAMPRGAGRQVLYLRLPALQSRIQRLRLDLATEPSLLHLYQLTLSNAARETVWHWSGNDGVPWDDAGNPHQIVHLDHRGSGGGLRLAAAGADAHFALPILPGELNSLSAGASLAVEIEFGDSVSPLQLELEQARAAIATAQQQVNQLQAENATIKRDQETLRRELEAVTNSRSWQITAPLRKTLQLLRPGDEPRK